MTLRVQLFLVSLLMLALPWAGCQYIREMESALRQGHEDALLSSARAVASVFDDRPDLIPPPIPEITTESTPLTDVYAQTLASSITLDGYRGDWGPGAIDTIALRAAPDGPGSFSVHYSAGIQQAYCYFYFEINDSSVKYDRPASTEESDGLHFVAIDADGKRNDLFFATEAPGPVNPHVLVGRDPNRRTGRRELRIQGVWQETRVGYNLEIRVPRAFIGDRAGFSVRNVRSGGPAGPSVSLGTLGGESGAEPGLFRHRLNPVQATLADLDRAGQRIRITDATGWLIGETGRLSDPSGAGPGESGEQSIIEELYLTILGRDRDAAPLSPGAPGKLSGRHIEQALDNDIAAAAWFRDPVANFTVLAAAYPIRASGNTIGAAIVEQTSDAILTLTNHALTRLLNVTLLASFLAALGLLGYATWLSIRIRTLRNAADRAVSPDGRITADFPNLKSADELGDLSRSFDRLLRQLREYTDYLKTLADKLTHELRTPLSIVKTSLDNLEAEELPQDSRIYARRAMEGAERLQRILKAMSEASRIEQSIRGAEKETFDLKELLHHSILSYRDLYKNRRFENNWPQTVCEFNGVPELIGQMMDKLVDNAVDFSVEGSRIVVSLDGSEDGYRISVANEGRPLPATMQSQMFDSMVSIREERDDEPHLGLGLFVVRLIVEFHDGVIRAGDFGGGGAEFIISLPRD